MNKARKTTKQKLIEAACEVFSQKGYREATIADICAQAQSNIAAVNYHFGDKENLYAHAWRYAFDQSLEAYPPEGELTEDAPANERLKARISSLINRILDEGKVGYFSRMLFAEMATPTNSIDEVIGEAVMPQREKMFTILAKLLGEAATSENICLCGMCIMNMCSMFAMNTRLRKKIFLQNPHIKISKEMLTEHIYSFAMGGIEECRNKYMKENTK
jgi:AcrR family transcriptional regulator